MIDTDFVPNCLNCDGAHDVRERNEEIVRLRADVARLRDALFEVEKKLDSELMLDHDQMRTVDEVLAVIERAIGRSSTSKAVEKP